MIMIEYSNGQRVTIEEFRAKHKNVVFGEKPSAEFLASIGASLVVDSDRLANEIRAHRSRLLAQTDYMALSDNTLTPEWASYRQALRDITDQEGFPHNVAWPEAPNG